ncbi:hypothetical protein JCM9279_006912 [Rhodotorula babjevae]
MAKLRKARPDPASLAPPAASSSSSSPPVAARGSTSSRRPPSLLTAGAGARTSPVALRTSSYLAPSVGASRIEAHGELIEGDSASEAESRSLTHTQRSRSPTSSSIRSHPPTASSPPASPRSHRRIASTASTAESLGTPATSPEQPRRSLHAPSYASSTAEPSTPSASSALAKLRTRLDSDQVAREAQRLQQEHAHAAGGKIRKKLPREVALDVAAHEHLKHEHAVVPAHDEPPSAAAPEPTFIEASDEAARPAAPPPDGAEGSGPIEQERTSSEAAASSPGEDASAVEAEPVEPEGLDEQDLSASTAAPRIEEALEGLNAAATAPPPSKQGSLLLAPARFGLRLAGGALSLGVGTTRSVLLQVPVVSSVVHSVDDALEGVSHRFATRHLSLGGPADEQIHLPGRGAPLTGEGDMAQHGETSKTVNDFAPDPSPGHSPSTLSRLAAVPLAPVHLAYSTARFSLTVSVASVLVARTVSGMVYDLLRGRPVRSPCE